MAFAGEAAQRLRDAQREMLVLVQGGVPMASLRHAMTMAPMRAASMPMPMPVVQVAPVQLSMLAPVHEVYALPPWLLESCACL